MKKAVATLTSKGQLTLPADVRRHLGVGKGGKVTFTIEDDGSVRVEANRFPTIDSIMSLSATLPRPMTKREMIELAREEQVVEPFRRKRERQG